MIANNRALVVEPDAQMRRTLVNMLRDRKLVVTSVELGNEAVEELASTPAYGLVITEMNLGAGHPTGSDLVRIMRERDNDAPVILFTAAVPPCIRPIPGVDVFDKLVARDPGRLVERINGLTK